ncbi:Bacterio-opsin activator HTH domain-containing protein [Salinarchaeum sp. Harcht-Bsk1]|uniref:helix-turn-helix domain-containing protein n=1 Tax=Salinarchaeum sp. Harcht-Bsk1 TaxID=1333523 RepID=UPI0003423F11|nr:helix-turn-helix domain-containing protein [Salinarchaeum sp. Harcht-Bsk1]AGN00048.1 Bacterio-opsin activator HTH domain-containing protein [Salinarchaeum sp. Harcht-Bsk1]
MTHAELTVTLPDGTWVKDVSAANPDATFRVLAALPGTETGFGLVELVADDPRPVLTAMEDHDAITRIELLQAGEDRAMVQFETTQPLLLFSARESRMPIELPIDIVDGTTTLELTASRDRLSELAHQFDAFGLDYAVEYVSPRVESERLLTDRQRELVTTAIEMGYYDTPREASMTELAEALDIAKSTCSETLHRAEEKVIKRFSEGTLHDTDPATVEPQ